MKYTIFKYSNEYNYETNKTLLENSYHTLTAKYICNKIKVTFSGQKT